MFAKSRCIEMVSRTFFMKTRYALKKAPPQTLKTIKRSSFSEDFLFWKPFERSPSDSSKPFIVYL